MVTVKQLINELKKFKNQDADVLEWRWTGQGARLQFLNLPCTMQEFAFILCPSETPDFSQDEYLEMNKKYLKKVKKTNGI